MNKQYLFVELPLYMEIKPEINDENLVKLILGKGTIDAWCPRCKEKSIYSFHDTWGGYNAAQSEKPAKLPFGNVIREGKCTRNKAGEYSSCGSLFIVSFLSEYGGNLTKISQYPSSADIAFGELDSAFTSQLESGQRAEIGRAVGLHSHGVGIGSFVYLRRIFEGLIDEAHLIASDEASWDEEQFRKSRMKEKVSMLSNHLPRKIVSNTSLYSVLSKGIHQLSEEECLQNFPLLMKSIEMILKQKQEEKEYGRLADELSQVASAEGDNS